METFDKPITCLVKTEGSHGMNNVFNEVFLRHLGLKPLEPTWMDDERAKFPIFLRDAWHRMTNPVHSVLLDIMGKGFTE
jgi:hypothetical protein